MLALVPIFPVLAGSGVDLTKCGKYTIVPGPLTGSYTGEWESGGVVLKHTLVLIEHTKAGNMIALYASGTAPEWGIKKPSCIRVSGRIENNIVTLYLFRSIAVYTFGEDGKVTGDYSNSRGRVSGKFERVANYSIIWILSDKWVG